MEFNINEAVKSCISVKQGMKKEYSFEVKLRFDKEKVNYSDVVSEIEAIYTKLREKFPSSNGVKQ